jgi:beta-lactamase class D
MRYFLPGFFLLVFFSINSCRQKNRATSPPAQSSITGDSTTAEEIRNDFKKFYDEYNVDGMFVLYDPKNKKYLFYNKSLYHQPATPASTFNITNALVGLEEGSIKDEHSVFTWSGRKYSNPIACQDLDLETAFKYNIDWWFWRLRLKTGAKKMKYWLDKIEYANLAAPETIDSFKVTPFGVDSFWVVSGALRITPAQQLEFIKRFYYEQLSFSKRSTDIVKRILFEKDTAGCKIYGKRGSYRLRGENKYIGWFVGYVETKDNVYFFVNYLQSPDLEHPRIVDAQKSIPFRIFQTLDLGK